MFRNLRSFSWVVLCVSLLGIVGGLRGPCECGGIAGLTRLDSTVEYCTRWRKGRVVGGVEGSGVGGGRVKGILRGLEGLIYGNRQAAYKGISL
jgi:hypothetical protein